MILPKNPVKNLSLLLRFVGSVRLTSDEDFFIPKPMNDTGRALRVVGCGVSVSRRGGSPPIGESRNIPISS